MKNKAWIGLAAGIVAAAGLTTWITVGTTTYLAKEVHICEIDDFHGKMPGYGDDFFKPAVTQAGAIRLSQEIQKIVTKYPGSVVLAGGDQNSSGPFSTCTQGDTMYPVLSAMDIRYSVVGNHAWDFGSEKLINKTFDKLGRTSDTVDNYFVTSNVLTDKSLQEHNWVYHEYESGFAEDYALWQAQRVKWADPYKIIDMGGHKISFIGLTTQDTREDGRQIELTNTCFIDYLPAISYTKHQMKQDLGDNQFNRIEAFVLYTHIPAHYDEETQVYSGQAIKLAQDVEDQVDLILAAHSHSDIATYVHNTNLNKDIPVLEAKAQGEAFADAALIFDNSKPEGKRLKEIKVRDVDMVVSTDFDTAAKEIQTIRDNPYNDVVKNTIKVYDEQKEVAKGILDKDLATSTKGLAFDFSWEWPTDYKIPLQAGVYAAKSNIKGFEIKYKDDIEQGLVYKPSISFISKDSIQQAIDIGKVKTRDIYGIYPFDNYPAYCTLTYHQVEQVVKYILSGADTSVIKRYYNTDTYYYDNNDTEIVELGDDLRFSYGPSQYYGLSFECTKQDTPDEQGRRFVYKANSLKIYDPDKPENFDDPTKWEGKDFWDGKLIGCCMSNFNFDGGNKQYLMISKFGKYNSDKDPNNTKAQIRYYHNDLRDLPIEYTKWINDNGQTVDIDQSILEEIFKIVTE